MKWKTDPKKSQNTFEENWLQKHVKSDRIKHFLSKQHYFTLTSKINNFQSKLTTELHILLRGASVRRSHEVSFSISNAPPL